MHNGTNHLRSVMDKATLRQVFLPLLGLLCQYNFTNSLYSSSPTYNIYEKDRREKKVRIHIKQCSVG